MDANQLIGGMALPHGVLLLSRKRVALGYYDTEGALRLYTRELKSPTGGVKSLWTLLSESLRALWRTSLDQNSPDQNGLLSMVAGGLAGIPLGLLLRWGASLPSGQWSLLSSALLVLMFLAAYGLYPPFRRGLARMARYHGAEHKTVWALERGKASPEGVRRQPLLHPACGSNLAALYLMVWFLILPLLLFFPWLWWLQFLVLLPLLPVFGWMGRHPEHPLSRGLLALGYRLQRHTLAEPGEAELEAAWRAVQGLEMENPSSVVEGSGRAVPTGGLGPTEKDG